MKIIGSALSSPASSPNSKNTCATTTVSFQDIVVKRDVDFYLCIRFGGFRELLSSAAARKTGTTASKDTPDQLNKKPRLK